MIFSSPSISHCCMNLWTWTHLLWLINSHTQLIRCFIIKCIYYDHLQTALYYRFWCHFESSIFTLLNHFKSNKLTLFFLYFDMSNLMWYGISCQKNWMIPWRSNYIDEQTMWFWTISSFDLFIYFNPFENSLNFSY